MRNIYRKLTVLSLLASIGSFFVGLLPFAMLVEKTSTDPNEPVPQTNGSTYRGNEPVTRERDERRERLKALCNWRIYEPKRQRLRDAYHNEPRIRYRSPVWLGTDPDFHFFYDFARDDIYCTRRERPGEPLVYGERTSDHGNERRRGILFCIIVMAICTTILHLIQVIRARR